MPCKLCETPHLCTLHRCSLQGGRGQRQHRCHATSELTGAPGLQGSLDVESQDRPQSLQNWLQDNGAQEQSVQLQETEVNGVPIDITVASRDIAAGEVALRVPDALVVTLDRVFEDETVAEVLTTDKLSELACLTLYLMCAPPISIAVPLTCDCSHLGACWCGCQPASMWYHTYNVLALAVRVAGTCIHYETALAQV